MSSKYKYLIKNILLFAISSFVPKLLSFILVPIYTGVLTIEEYGIADMLSVTVLLVLPIFTLTIRDAVLRFLLNEKYNQRDVISIGLQITFVGATAITILTIIAYLLFDFVKFEYAFFFSLMYVVSAFKDVLSVIMRGSDMVSLITLGGILNSIITLSANIIFLLFFKWGLKGYLMANVLGSTVFVFVQFVCGKLYRNINWKINKVLRKEMIKFSIPMIFSSLAWWINNASDRYLLSWISGVTVSGLYAIASKIPSILSVFQDIFSKAWSVSAVKEFDSSDSDGFIGNLYTIFHFGVLFIASLLIMSNLFASKLLFSNDFYVAWKFVPPLIVACVFNALSLFTGSIFMSVNDTKSRSVATIIGAISNIAFNIVLIPKFSGYGAAIATAIGFMLTYIYQEIKIRKHITIKTQYGKNYIACSMIIIQMVLGYNGNDFMILQVLIMVLICTLYINVIKAFFARIVKRYQKIDKLYRRNNKNTIRKK